MQKSKAIILRHPILKKLTIFFRFMDTFVFLTIISRFSGHHFRGISFANYSPILAFVTGNAIILLLIFKSRLIHENGDGDDDDDSNNNGGTDFYDACFKSYEKSLIDSDTTRSMDATGIVDPSNGYKICRSRSEDLMRGRGGEDEITHRKLRRSVTERRRLDRRCCDGYAEEEMSGEEFRRTVEAFIARQQKSLTGADLPLREGGLVHPLS